MARREEGMARTSGVDEVGDMVFRQQRLIQLVQEAQQAVGHLVGLACCLHACLIVKASSRDSGGER